MEALEHIHVTRHSSNRYTYIGGVHVGMLLVLMSAESEAHLPVRGAGCGCLPLHLGALPGPPLHAVAAQPIQDGGRRTTRVRRVVWAVYLDEPAGCCAGEIVPVQKRALPCLLGA